jgi:hypothetical protein
MNHRRACAATDFFNSLLGALGMAALLIWLTPALLMALRSRRYAIPR